MQASQVAAQLSRAGVAVKSHSEGDMAVDGAVWISESVSVQVPVMGYGYSVTRRDGDSFEFFPRRSSLKALIADINKAAA